MSFQRIKELPSPREFSTLDDVRKYLAQLRASLMDNGRERNAELDAINAATLPALGTANQILGVNAGATDEEYKTLTAGANISVTHAAGSVTLAATGLEAALSAGATTQYYRGDKSWQTLNQAAVDGLKTTNSPSFAGLGLTGNASMTWFSGYRYLEMRYDSQYYQGLYFNGSDANLYLLCQSDSIGGNIYLTPSGTAAGSVILDSRVGVGQSTFGTSATKTVAVGTGTAPSTSPADAFQMYSADQAAGNACAHFRTELGQVVKLYQQAHIADEYASWTGGNLSTAGDIASALNGIAGTINTILARLENLGLSATS